MPAVTVLMPVYNGAKYLQEALESVTAQTFQDFEILAINDGSTDDSPRLLADYQARDSRLIVHHQHNAGVIATLNRGITLARGAYIARMDCDNVCHPRRMEKQVEFMERHPQVGICGTFAETFSARDSTTIRRFACDHHAIHCALLFGSAIVHPTAMMRTRVMAQYGLYYDPDFVHAEDYDLWVRAVRTMQVANLPEVLLRYRLHPEQVTNRYSPQKEANADRIRLRQLRELGLQPSAIEQNLHHFLYDDRRVKSRDELLALQQWITVLDEANQQVRQFAPPPLRHELANRWVSCCIRAAALGLSAWQTCWRFSLAAQATASFRTRAAFAWRCARKLPFEKELTNANRDSQVIASPRTGGGIAASAFNLFHAFRRHGQEVRVFTYADSRPYTAEEGITRSGLPSGVPNFIWATLWVWYKILRGERGSGGGYAIAGCLTSALAVRRIWRRILHYAPDMIIVPDHGAPIAFCPSNPRVCIIYVAHHIEARFGGEPLLGFHAPREIARVTAMEQRALDRADGVVCVSRYMATVARATYRCAVPMTVIPNPIAVEEIDRIPPGDHRTRYQLAAATPIVYIPSAGSVYKGSAFVPEIVQRIAHAYAGKIGFYLSGQPDAQLQRLLAFVPDNVCLIMPGQLPYHDHIALVKTCTVCVSPTLIESFGMALLEAQCCGLPVVAFDVGGNRDVVIDDITGYLVPFAAVEILSETTIRLLERC